MLEIIQAIFLILLLIGVFLLMLRVMKSSFANNDTIKGRDREEVLRDFHRTHTRIRRKRPDLAKKMQEPTQEQMHAAIDDFVEKDARKAAGSLKKIMDSDMLRKQRR